MSLEGGEGIGVAAVATKKVLLLLLVNPPLAGMMMMILGETNLEGSRSQNQRIGTTIATWMMTMMIIALVVTHLTVLDHPEAGRGVIQTIPILPIRVVLGPDPGPDRCLWHLIRHHPPLRDGMIENIAVMVVDDTVVEVGVAVEIEITTGAGDHHPMVVRGGVTTVIVIMGGVETIDEGGNRLIINVRDRVLNRHIHLRTGEDVGDMEKIVVLRVAEGNYLCMTSKVSKQIIIQSFIVFLHAISLISIYSIAPILN